MSFKYDFPSFPPHRLCVCDLCTCSAGHRCPHHETHSMRFADDLISTSHKSFVAIPLPPRQPQKKDDERVELHYSKDLSSTSHDTYPSHPTHAYHGTRGMKKDDAPGTLTETRDFQTTSRESFTPKELPSFSIVETETDEQKHATPCLKETRDFKSTQTSDYPQHIVLPFERVHRDEEMQSLRENRDFLTTNRSSYLPHEPQHVERKTAQERVEMTETRDFQTTHRAQYPPHAIVIETIQTDGASALSAFSIPETRDFSTTTKTEFGYHVITLDELKARSHDARDGPASGLDQHVMRETRDWRTTSRESFKSYNVSQRQRVFYEDDKLSMPETRDFSRSSETYGHEVFHMCPSEKLLHLACMENPPLGRRVGDHFVLTQAELMKIFADDFHPW
eukprot:TRINITY_DN58313_c0_g1_i1.p1 TRINITY_DN58313_c0_g1~~TRINITY_DN58313_c0_g1_i1.p1  ORF type:complete len:393 (-),score=95.77 TRINITY_DN58313_c0_g1_i1:45-1223(-)